MSGIFEDVQPAAFDEIGGPGEPTESDWIVIGDRRYKVFALPRKTPTFTCYFGYGGLTEALLGGVVMLFATRGDDAWGARIYWAKNRWYNAPYHQCRRTSSTPKMTRRPAPPSSSSPYVRARSQAPSERTKPCSVTCSRHIRTLKDTSKRP